MRSSARIFRISRSSRSLLRKSALTACGELTLTGLYNVLQKVGAGDTALTAKEKAIHEKGLVGVLRQLHEELAAAVLDAYGWRDLIGQIGSDETLLERLVAPNAARAVEEAQGTIRWLRPEFQSPDSAAELVEAAPMAGEAMQPPQRARMKGAAPPPSSVPPSAPVPEPACPRFLVALGRARLLDDGRLTAGQ